MKRFLIETSVIVDYLRGKKEMVELVNNLEGELTSSFVCLAELYEGVCRLKKNKKAEAGVLNLFKGLNEVHGLDKEIAKNFGRIRYELKVKGRAIEDLDILIAATCFAHNLILVTKNIKHFSRIEGLKILKF